jgi:uncharacterized protein (UPF0276 family)
VMTTCDLVGIAWRDEYALQVYNHLEQIDCIEVLADREIYAPRGRIKALRELARQRPLSLHSVALGLASAEPVESRRLARIAALVHRIEPQFWSEHLAFVRAGGIEIGHLAAAPYAPETLAGTCENVERARRSIGSLPHLENVATLLEPPGSPWSETEFVSRVARHTQAPILLDLHNMYANAINFGHDPFEALREMPIASVRTVHISGGCVVRDSASFSRLIDDHAHDPPSDVYVLLECLASIARNPLTVILERDGDFPAFDELLRQLGRTRAALAAGRRLQTGQAA